VEFLFSHASLLTGEEGVINNVKYSAGLQNMITDMLEEHKTVLSHIKGIEQRLR
jgi:hypothetical protein